MEESHHLQSGPGDCLWSCSPVTSISPKALICFLRHFGDSFILSPVSHMPPAQNDQLTPKAKRKDSSRNEGGCWSYPTVAGFQVVLPTFQVLPPFTPPCNNDVGRLSNSKVWQHGSVYALISLRGGGGEEEGEAELELQGCCYSTV